MSDLEKLRGAGPEPAPQQLKEHILSNHSQDDDLPDFLREKLLPESLRKQLGATGRFPLGKLTPDDEGEIQFAVAADPQTKTVILDFGKPIVWLGLPRGDAKKLAEMLMEKIKELE